MATDVLGLGMALAAIQAAATNARNHQQRTFGLYRLEILAALANAVLLFGVAGYIGFEAINRLSDAHDVASTPVLVVDVIGLVVNVIEAVIAIVAGSAAGSIALIGFGLDSIVEVLSALVVVWHLNGVSEERERTALKLIAVTFYLLASYVAVRAMFDLISRTKPDTSLVGIGVAIASMLMMPSQCL